MRSGTRLLIADRVRTANGIQGDAVLIADRHVVAVGEANELRSPSLPEERFPGATIIPGLRDAHFHPVSYAAAIRSVSLKDARSLHDLAGRLRAAAARLGPGEPLVAIRLDDEGLAERRLPTRVDLDAAVPDRPVLLHRYCGHIAVANSAALEAAGVTAATPVPPGGVIDRDEEHRPTGVLRETAIELVSTRLAGARTVTVDQFVEAMSALAGLGLTSIGGIVGCGDGPWATLGDETAVLIEAASRVPIKIHTLVIANDEPTLRDRAGAIDHAGGRVRWLGLKRFADGSLGGHTAAMHAPFSDRPQERGTLRLAAHDGDLARAALAMGGSVAIHAIGDLACTEALDLFQSLIDEGADPTRLRLEHASVLTRDAIDRIARLGVIASVQPAFLGSETGWLESRVGERLPLTYPLRSLASAGARLAGGSDCPVEPPHPLVGMALARDRAGIYPDESLDAAAALALFTDGAAAALREPAPLAPGSPADLVVVDRDPIEVTPDELRATEVVETIVDGQVVDVPRGVPVWTV